LGKQLKPINVIVFFCDFPQKSLLQFAAMLCAAFRKKGMRVYMGSKNNGNIW